MISLPFTSAAVISNRFKLVGLRGDQQFQILQQTALFCKSKQCFHRGQVHNMGPAYADRWGHLDVIITTIERGHYQGLGERFG